MKNEQEDEGRGRYLLCFEEIWQMFFLFIEDKNWILNPSTKQNWICTLTWSSLKHQANSSQLLQSHKFEAFWQKKSFSVEFYTYIWYLVAGKKEKKKKKVFSSKIIFESPIHDFVSWSNLKKIKSRYKKGFSLNWTKFSFKENKKILLESTKLTCIQNVLACILDIILIDKDERFFFFI